MLVPLDSLNAWLLAGHLIGIFLWIGGLATVYWLLRIHAHAPTAAHEKLTLMERSLALMTDVAATLAIGTGLAIAIKYHVFTNKPAGWFHIKLAIVALGVLPVHGMIRARIKKFQQGKITEVPQWQWTMLLGAIVAIVIVVTAVKFKMMTAG
jgi:uncharacterized membrane protein